jgi:uracil-DNA glycosylase family protein
LTPDIEAEPAAAKIARARAAAAECRDCSLYRDATQVVFGEGPVPAKLMLLGEQPGDKEDRSGHAFVGPAGAMLDATLAEAGIDRDRVYVTNAVKHFKWVRGHGKVRLHKSPSRSEVTACSQWWQQELTLVAPKVLVCLGAVATKAVLGPSVKLTEVRGQIVEQLDLAVIPTLHPAAVLRGVARRDELRAQLVTDLRCAATLLRR